MPRKRCSPDGVRKSISLRRDAVPLSPNSPGSQKSGLRSFRSVPRTSAKRCPKMSSPVRFRSRMRPWRSVVSNPPRMEWIISSVKSCKFSSSSLFSFSSRPLRRSDWARRPARYATAKKANILVRNQMRRPCEAGTVAYVRGILPNCASRIMPPKSARQTAVVMKADRLQAGGVNEQRHQQHIPDDLERAVPAGLRGGALENEMENSDGDPKDDNGKEVVNSGA